LLTWNRYNFNGGTGNAAKSLGVLKTTISLFVAFGNALYYLDENLTIIAVETVASPVIRGWITERAFQCYPLPFAEAQGLIVSRPISTC
jgi:hypothetical protein